MRRFINRRRNGIEPGESAAPEEDSHWPSDTEESSFASTIEEGQDMEV